MFVGLTHPRRSNALLRRDAVELHARPGCRRGALLLVRDVARLQSSHLGAVRDRLLGAEAVRDNLKSIGTTTGYYHREKEVK